MAPAKAYQKHKESIALLQTLLQGKLKSPAERAGGTQSSDDTDQYNRWASSFAYNS